MVFFFLLFLSSSNGLAANLPDRCRSGQPIVEMAACEDNSNVLAAIGNLSDVATTMADSSFSKMIGATTEVKASGTKFFEPTSAPIRDLRDSPLPFVDAGAALPSCQTMRGYGFGLTSSTVINYEKLPPRGRKDMMRRLFDPDQGANFSYLVLPMSTTDFNGADEEDFSVCDCKPGQTPDPKRHCFDPSRLEHQMKFLEEARKWNPDLKVMLKPWSPPPHMKLQETVNQKIPYRGGKFNIEWADSLGACLADATRYVQSRGIKVQSVAAQNEPGIQMPYPSVYMDEASQAKVLDGVYSRMKKEQPDLQLVLRSDNFNSAHEVLKTAKMITSGARSLVFAAHCYSGEPDPAVDAMPRGANAFCGGDQSIEYMLGECTGHTSVSDADFSWWMDKRVMTDTQMGATGTVTWNGILDEKHGPKSGGCEQCRGLATTDFSDEKKTKVLWNPEFYAVNHASRFLKPGAVRLVVDRENGAGVKQLLFKNPDDTTVGIFWNSSGETKRFRVVTRDCRESEIVMPPNTATTLTW